MERKVLIYGWYGHANLGDDLFVDAFKQIFPTCDLYFTDHINSDLLKDMSAVFFGGGSFLDAKPVISGDAYDALRKLPIFYISVGTETSIHPTHRDLLKIAKLIVTRSPEKVEEIKSINPNTIYMPDIVYALQNKINQFAKLQKSVLYIPNMEVVSKHSDPAWKHIAWEYFKSEFSQFLDVLVEKEYNISCFSFCNNEHINDNWAAIEILNKMKHRPRVQIIDTKITNMESLSKFLSQFETTITQRYHGIILSEMVRVPYLSIHHHDKLKHASPREGTSVSYYNLNKQLLLNEFFDTIQIKYSNELPIKSDTFIDLAKRVENLIGG